MQGSGSRGGGFSGGGQLLLLSLSAVAHSTWGGRRGFVNWGADPVENDDTASTYKRHLFVVGSLDKHMQNEKELIRLARAKGGGWLFCLIVESILFHNSHTIQAISRTSYPHWHFSVLTVLEQPPLRQQRRRRRRRSGSGAGGSSGVSCC